MTRIELGACFASVLIAALDAAVFALGRDQNRFQAGWSLWIVAEYSWPWALGCVVLAVVSAVAWLLHAAFVRKTNARRTALSALSVFAVSFVVSVEAGMGIYYQEVTGAFEIREFLLPRTSLDFPSNSDTVCVRADLRGPFSWRLNDALVFPRLLPLPLDDAALRERLLHPGDPAAAKTCP